SISRRRSETARRPESIRPSSSGQRPEPVAPDDTGQHLLAAADAVVDQEVFRHRPPEAALAQPGQVVLARAAVAPAIIHDERVDPIVLEAIERGVHALEDRVPCRPQVEVTDALVAYGEDPFGGACG